jgi:hypothetical protein
MALFEKTIVQATDVALHCEMTATTTGTPRTLPRMGTAEYLKASLSHLFEARMANSPTNAGDSAETPKLELSVGVTTPPGNPTIRVVEFLIGNQGKDGHIRLTYAPNPKGTTAIANNGRLIPTDLPDGFVRISGPDATSAK